MLQSTDSVTLFTKISLVLQLNIEFCAQWWFFVWWKFNYHFVAPGNSWICVLFTRMHGRIKDFAQIISTKFEPKPLCLETDVHLRVLMFLGHHYVKECAYIPGGEIFELIQFFFVFFWLCSMWFCGSFIFLCFHMCKVYLHVLLYPVFSYQQREWKRFVPCCISSIDLLLIIFKIHQFRN